MGGIRFFAETRANGEVAPITAIYATRMGLAGSSPQQILAPGRPALRAGRLFAAAGGATTASAAPSVDVGILRWSKPDLEKLFDGYCACCEAPFQD